jgi:hypothetical protein
MPFLRLFVHKIGDIWYNIRISNDKIMTSAMTKNRIQSDILEWYVPEEVLAVLLKDRSTGRNLIWVTDDYAACNECRVKGRILI